MNIAYYSHYFTPEIGAPSARLYDFSQQWLRMGHAIQVVTCFPNHPTGQLYPGYKLDTYQYEDLDGIDVHRHWTYITPNKGFLKKSLGHISYLPSSLLFSNPHIPKLDVAIGTSPTFFAAMAAAAIARQRHIPFIMEVRDLWPAVFVELGVLQNPRIIAWLEKLEIALYREATRIVTVTEAFRKNIIERGIAAEKVVTVQNGADIEFWKPQRPSSNLQTELNLSKRFIVLYIGTHGISQALTSIVESAKQLRQYPQIQFLFVGEGAEKEQLVSLANNYQLDNINFLDPVSKDKVRAFYMLADVCLVPLRDIPLFETFIPSKMFEMMAMERPIVASVRGESAEILQESGCALVVAPENSAAIAQAILTLYYNQEQARQMGKQGRTFVINHYSRRAMSTAYIEILQNAIQAYQAKKQDS